MPTKLKRGSACVYPTRFAGSSIENVRLSANPPSIAQAPLVSAHADVKEEDVGFSAGTVAADVLSRPAAGDRSTTTPGGRMGNGGRKSPGRATPGMSRKRQ